MDFESSASTNSATSAAHIVVNISKNRRKGKQEAKHIRPLVFIIILLSSCPLFGQLREHAWYDPLNVLSSSTLGRTDSVVTLPDKFIVPGSESVTVDTVRLRRDADYTLDPRNGILTIYRSKIFPADTARRRTVRMIYRRFPFSFQSSYELRKLVYQVDSLGRRHAVVQKVPPSFSVEDIFGPNLQKSGSIARGFTVGTDRDLSISSGFRMQLAGKLSQDIDIVASLTDENTPIQPEGNTQTLQEFDKVFVEISSPVITTTLGDFSLITGGSEFAGISRKLQGAKAAAASTIGSTSDTVLISGSVARGKFTTNQFNGIDGVQGPYRLLGRNNERSIIVIAGTEKVYVNGEFMTRGEANDYTVDYSNAEVTFSARRLITSLTRITIDFQYTDQQYTRSLLTADARSSLAGGNVRLGVTYMREADNPDATIDLQLSDADKALLGGSGADRTKATKPGAIFVGRDSVTGAAKGQYSAVDTVVGGAPTRIYRYVPGSSEALYAVTFTYVGDGAGDYRKESIGNYSYTGPGQGAYVPVVYLPLPEERQLADLRLNASPFSFIGVTGEYAFSRYNANRFAPTGNAVTNGSAVNTSIGLTPGAILIGSANLGRISLFFHERYVGAEFTPLDRTNEIEFSRAWNISRPVAGDQEIREGTFAYSPTVNTSATLGYGLLKNGGDFETRKFSGDFSLGEKALPSATYSFENLSTTDRGLSLGSEWFRQHGLASYSIPVGGQAAVTPGFRFDAEDKRDVSSATDSLLGTSFRYVDAAPTITIGELWNMTLRGEVGIREEDAVSGGGFVRESISRMQTIGWKLREWKSLSSSIDLTFLRKRFEKPFSDSTRPDINTVLLRTQTRFSPWNRALESDLYYEVATERSAKLERVFVRVPTGTGNYKYLGDVNGNGVADEPDFALTRFDGDYIVTTVPTDQFIPVIDLKSSARLRLNGQRFFPSPAGPLASVLSILSSETYLRVEERSTDQNLSQIYLLHLSHFLQESTTILGAQQVNQDLYLFENNKKLSVRFRFTERQGLSQYSSQTEHTLAIDRGGRVQWQLIPEISHQFEIISRRDRLLASVESDRVRDIAATVMNSDLSYRPEQNLEIGFVASTTSAHDEHPAVPTDATIQVLGLRGVRSLLGKGQVRIEIQREDVRLGESVSAIPYELTGGRVAGKTWLWSATAEYRLGGNIQASLNYTGRSEGGRPAVHTARMEVRAFF